MGTFLLSNRFLNLPHLELYCLHLACLPSCTARLFEIDRYLDCLKLGALSTSRLLL